MNIPAIFRDFYNGQRNVLTPSQEEFGQCLGGRLVYEISKGRGFNHEYIYGVTFLEKHAGEWRKPEPRINRGGFLSLKDAHEYIASIKGLSE